MVKFPLTNPNEMRGFLYSDISNPEIFRERLAARLRGQADNDYIPVAASAKWETLFRDAFPDVPLQDPMTLEKIQIALASYIRSQIFVDNAWHDYLDALPYSVASGQENARITDKAKAGAKLFYSDISEGGAGCYQCHSGDRFTNEDFYNVGFPQIGRGFLRADREDRGRWHSTREDDSWYSFRVPSLLNVAVTAPWGHAGTFSDLNELIRYHADPLSQIDVFDWELGHLDQFDNNGRLLYPQAEELTRQSLAHPSFSQAEQLLPGPLSESSVEALSAFLNTLTDKCVSDIGCISQWAPDASDDPDGYLLVEGDMPVPPFVDTVTPEQYPKSFALDFPVVGNGTFPELNDECGVNTVASNTGVNQFQERALSLGLTKEHGFHYETWFGGSNAQTEAVMIAGGVSAAYLDNDCWPDLIFSGGDVSGVVFYTNEAGDSFSQSELFEEPLNHARFTGSAYADLNGDYNRELLFGNMWEEGAATPVFAINEVGKYVNLATLPMSRSVYGISFGFVGNHDYPGFYMGHWPGQGLAGAAPAFMQMTDGATLEPFDQMVNLTTSSVDQSFNFTPLFHDLNGDSYQDILIASDFGTSSVLENITSDEVADTDWRFFNNITDRDVITDENGMGSTTGDFENRGKIDWFVTSILDPDGEAEANWGVSGNRLYRNESADGAISFSDVTEQSGLRDGGWGWGACSFDFNNDGFLDIFHVNGFGYIADIADLPESETDKFEALRARWNEITETEFQQKPPKLFINNGDGSFDDRSAEWGLTLPSEGRGLACFDYDRDGDVDIAVFDHSNRLQFFENKTGNGDGSRFLNVRLVGESPNTDALGAKVYVTADVGRQFGQQTMMRVSQANSNFNSQNLPDMHFGLGYADNIQTLSVTWPDGSELVCEDLPVNEFVVIDQRQGSGAGVCP